MKVLNNNILCRLYRDNKELTTKGGIIISPKQSVGREAIHVNRIYEVIGVPEKFMFWKNKAEKENQVNYGRNQNLFVAPEWDTDIECKPGDIVLTNKSGALNASNIENEYFINYVSIYMILRPGGNMKEIEGKMYDVIMANGYILCEEIVSKKQSKYLEVVDFSDIKEFGKVMYVGKPNKEYYNDLSDKIGIDIVPGDIIRKMNSAIHLDLENGIYKFFDLINYFVIQRPDIASVIKNP